MRAEDQAIIYAAREWMIERTPKDDAEKALMLALMKGFPQDIHTRESCDCGVSDCEECLPAAAIPNMLKSLEPQPAN